MNRKQIAFLNMCAKVQATCDAHTADWSSFPLFATPYPRLATLQQDATDAAALQQTSSKGATQSKALLRQILISHMMQLADTLVLWGLTTGASRQLAEDARTNKSSLDVWSEEKVAGRAAKLLSLTPGADGTPPTPPAGLATLGITAAFITQLKADLVAFTSAQGTPGHVQAESIRGTGDLEGVIEALVQLFKELDPAARVLQYTKPAFYSEYSISRRIDDAGYGVRELAVTVLDSATAEPLAGVLCRITPGDIEKTTGNAGGFYIDDLDGGDYAMTLELAGYVTKTVAFSIVDGQATVAEYKMTKAGGGGSID